MKDAESDNSLIPDSMTAIRGLKWIQSVGNVVFSPNWVFFSVSKYHCALTKKIGQYRKIPTQRPPPSKRPPPFSAPKVLQRGHISSCNRPERLFLGTCRLTLYEKCSVMVTFLFHQLSCQMSSRAIAHPLVSGALNAKRPWAIGRDFTVLLSRWCYK